MPVTIAPRELIVALGIPSTRCPFRTSRCVCAFASSAIFLLGAIDAAVAETKHVLMLRSFGLELNSWSEYARNIHAEIDKQSRWPLEFSDHSVITARCSDEEAEAPLVEYLRALYGKRPPDLIVSLGAPAVAFVERHRGQLFASTPMVFTAVEQRRVRYSTLTANDTVVAVANSFQEFFESILRVLPSQTY